MLILISALGVFAIGMGCYFLTDWILTRFF